MLLRDFFVEFAYLFLLSIFVVVTFWVCSLAEGLAGKVFICLFGLHIAESSEANELSELFSSLISPSPSFYFVTFFCLLRVSEPCATPETACYNYTDCVGAGITDVAFFMNIASASLCNVLLPSLEGMSVLYRLRGNSDYKNGVRL